MKTYNPRLIACSVFATVCMLASLGKAAVIITDNFSDNPVGLTTAGGQITPSYSAAGTKWTVVGGAFSTDGTGFSPTPPAGQLAFSNTQASNIRIDFGPVELNTAASVQFSLREATVTAPVTQYVDVFLGNSSTGTYYTIRMALSTAYFGTSGFSISRPGGTFAAPGLAGAYMNGTAFNTYNISFSPTSGVVLMRDGITVASSLSAPPVGFNKVDYFAISNGNAASLNWFMDNVSIDAVLVPEPATWLMMGCGLISVIALRRRSVI